MAKRTRRVGKPFECQVFFGVLLGRAFAVLCPEWHERMHLYIDALLRRQPRSTEERKVIRAEAQKLAAST